MTGFLGFLGVLYFLGIVSTFSFGLFEASDAKDTRDNWPTIYRMQPARYDAALRHGRFLIRHSYAWPLVVTAKLRDVLNDKEPK